MATTKVTTDVIDMSGNTGGLTWVKGTTAEQPSGVIGEIREDTDTKRALVYTDETGTSEWRNLKEASVSQTFTADYLIVAGGGGGGYDAGGGGGAGGYLTSLSEQMCLRAAQYSQALHLPQELPIQLLLDQVAQGVPQARLKELTEVHRVSQEADCQL